MSTVVIRSGSSSPKFHSSLENNYIVGNEIGRGSFSVVHEATHRVTGEKWAVKTILKNHISKKGWINLSREIEILVNVNHPNILKMKEFFNTDDSIHLVLEYMTGGELFDQIIKRGSFGERDASSIVKQILSGIAYLHGMGIAHRDLKPENLLCSSSDSRVVVADFGLAKIFGRGELLRTHCGTPSYAAPEVVRGDDTYDKAVDLWSIGVITFVLLCGFFPFYHDDQEMLRKKIISADFIFPSPYWDNISESAKHFIINLLVADPAKRFTAEQALAHPWIQGDAIKIPNVLNLRSSMESFQQTQKKLRESGTIEMTN